MPISPQSGDRGFERLIWLKYYTERQIIFNLGLNADKNTTSKKGSSKNGSQFNFLQKNQWVHMSISPRSGARVLEFLFK